MKIPAQHCPLPPLSCSNEVFLLLGNPYIYIYIYIQMANILKYIVIEMSVIHELCCKTNKLYTIHFVGLNV
jgi:hypothetical protein